jgi:hypothetical protein
VRRVPAIRREDRVTGRLRRSERDGARRDTARRGRRERARPTRPDATPARGRRHAHAAGRRRRRATPCVGDRDHARRARSDRKRRRGAGERRRRRVGKGQRDRSRHARVLCDHTTASQLRGSTSGRRAEVRAAASTTVRIGLIGRAGSAAAAVQPAAPAAAAEERCWAASTSTRARARKSAAVVARVEARSSSSTCAGQGLGGAPAAPAAVEARVAGHCGRETRAAAVTGRSVGGKRGAAPTAAGDQQWIAEVAAQRHARRTAAGSTGNPFGRGSACASAGVDADVEDLPGSEPRQRARHHVAIPSDNGIRGPARATDRLDRHA